MQTFELECRVEVDMVQSEDRQHPGIGSRPVQMAPDIGVLEVRFESSSHCATHPLVEIAEDDTRPAQLVMTDDPFFEQPPCLLTMFHESRSKMHIEDMQRRSVDLNIGSQAASPLAAGFCDVIVPVDMNREATQHDVSVTSAFQSPGLTECEVKTQLIRYEPELISFAAAAFDAQHFLERNNIGIDRLQYLDDPVRADAPVQAAAFMHVVGNDSDLVGLSHDLTFEFVIVA